MSPAERALYDGALAAMAETVAHVTGRLRRGEVTLVAALAGLRLAGMVMQASVEAEGHDCSAVEAAMDTYLAAMEAGTMHRGGMQ